MINIVGTITGTSGYASHTKQLANALSKITDVRISSGIMPGQELSLTDKEIELLKKRGTENEINLIITNPLHWRQHLNQDRNWVFLICEGDSVADYIVEECLNPEIEYVFVASEHSKKALEETLQRTYFHKADEVLDKVRIMNHGVDLSKFYKKEVEKPFTFLANKGFRHQEDRGGIQYLIKAFIEEFGSKEDVRLLVKINPAYGVLDMNKYIQSIAGNMKPNIVVDARDVPFDKMVDFYAQGDVFVSPTRGEAFNLPCLEAMACGLPVLTTNFGGQTDFVNNKNGWLIDYELEEVTWELQYEGVNWANPNIETLKKTMKEVYNDAMQRKEKGKEALETAKEFTWDKTSQKIKELI